MDQKIRLFLILAISSISYRTHALPSVPGCPPITEDYFSYSDIVGMADGLREIMKMAFWMNEDGTTDIFFTERGNNNRSETATVKLYRTATDELTTIAELEDTDSRREDGLLGIALDPLFHANGWVYLYQSVVGAWDIVRYQFDGTKLDLSSKTLILEIPVTENMPHTGGDMLFDPAGNLWASTGDNGERPMAPCLTDLRAGIIRIKPLPAANGTMTPGVGVTYSIPAGNFAEYFSATIPEYAQPGKVAPEIYLKGNRNPYTMTYFPSKNWIAWGDCGPDGLGPTEEHNLAVAPGFHGWPYFAGDNVSAGGGGGQNPQSPTAPTSCGAGSLPPAIPSISPYPQACAMTGPLISYSPSSPNTGKFPPHFHGTWILLDINYDWAKLAYPNAQGSTLTKTEDLFTSYTFDNVLDMEMGPDGILYVSNYSGYESWNQATRISKIEYAGPDIPKACVDAVLGTNAVPGCMQQGHPNSNPAATYHDQAMCAVPLVGVSQAVQSGESPFKWNAAMGILEWSSSAPVRAELLDVKGAVLRSETAADGAWNLKQRFPAGVYRARIQGPGTSYIKTVLVY